MSENKFKGDPQAIHTLMLMWCQMKDVLDLEMEKPWWRRALRWKNNRVLRRSISFMDSALRELGA